MTASLPPRLEARLCRSADELRQAQALRYRVFVAELGGTGDGVDHHAGIESDEFDAHCRHLVLLDDARPDRGVVGAYRLLDDAGAAAAGGFYTETEYDLGPLKSIGPAAAGTGSLVPGRGLSRRRGDDAPVAGAGADRSGRGRRRSCSAPHRSTAPGLMRWRRSCRFCTTATSRRPTSGRERCRACRWT